MAAAASLEELGGWPEVLGLLAARTDLPRALASAAVGSILAGEATDAQLGGFLIGLRAKGEAVDEVTAMVEAMLAAAAPIELPPGPEAVDIVGTGGAPTRRVHALNVSTMASLVATGAGARVVKHGNRKASSTSGSVDLLEALGVVVDLDGDGVARCVRDAGMGFCFARAFHPAMRHAAAVRTELGVPTVFNLLGPLSHPAGVTRQVLGVSDPALAPLVVGVLREREAPRAMVVSAHDGTDELVTTGPTTVHELRDGRVDTYELQPGDLGLTQVDPGEVAGGDPAANAAIARRVLAGEHGPYRDIVVLNAAAALVVAGIVDALGEGLALAAASIDSGAAAAVLARLVDASRA
ncbi:MAG: anthranilate phosphoribosyltransferase [Acidimicrobiales bacterium]|nr:anthranilate phosphoribosyltransferase [Acidimicrobiales bacterium]